ncbi:MAG: prepilin-type N-terminal cleavage/methylation domain-containing protein [Eubacterium sp.]|nr:prepilin-type N-terminal cleavage/methylation domain-containing protein [Eubacterium sp.]
MKNRKYSAKDGFSMVELIITIAIMAILVGVIFMAVLPNIQRSRESKDISQLDGIASAANSAIAAMKAKEEGIINLGTTSTGVQDVSGFNSISDPTEAQRIQHAIYETVSEGAGITESEAAGSSSIIALAYDVSGRRMEVAYVESIPSDTSTYTPLTPLTCNQIDSKFIVTN